MKYSNSIRSCCRVNKLLPVEAQRYLAVTNGDSPTLSFKDNLILRKVPSLVQIKSRRIKKKVKRLKGKGYQAEKANRENFLCIVRLKNDKYNNSYI